ncbi:MAG: WhiB family transcriptional regulator [Pseudonocardiaceae bacterium]
MSPLSTSRPATSDHTLTKPVAACWGVDPEVFFGPCDSPEGGPTAAWELKALAVCGDCPLVGACLKSALEFRASEQHGVVGGMTAGQRRQVLRLTRQQPTRSYLAGMAGPVMRRGLPREVDEMAVAGLMAGDRPCAARRAEVAHAAIELHRGGHGPTSIAGRLGVSERQVRRWLERHRAGQPLTPPGGRRPASTRNGAAA